MIVQYLPNNNETATVVFRQKNLPTKQLFSSARTPYFLLSYGSGEKLGDRKHVRSVVTSSSTSFK
jgi:hypothetical protein